MADQVPEKKPNETANERAAREQQERERDEHDRIVQKRRGGQALTCKERRTINDLTPECEKQLALEERLEKETKARRKRQEAAERTRQYRTSRERTRRSFNRTKQSSANRRAAFKRMASGS